MHRRTQRISRELFLAALGMNVGAREPWIFARLAAILEEEEFASGDCVYAANDTPDYFYFLRHGRVELARSGRPTETLEGPRAFGMIDAIVERPRSHSAFARAPITLLKVPAPGWFEILEDSFELARMSVLRFARSVASLEEALWAKGCISAPTPLRLDGTGKPLDLVERLAVLMQTLPLRGAGVQPISDLATECEEVSLVHGETLFLKGAPIRRIFVVVEGLVEATRARPEVTWRGGPGQVVCGVVSFGGARSEWEAHAATPVRALAFRIADWFDVMEENFEMVRATLTSLALEHERLGGAPI
jgi:CRP-like cAMP-binding protein